MRTKPFLTLFFIALILAGLDSCRQRNDIIIADFEGETYGEWTARGQAFVSGPSDGTVNDEPRLPGCVGEGMAFSYSGDNESAGKLVSPPFRIERNYINFLVGGSLTAGEVCVNLLVEDKIAATMPDAVEGSPARSQMDWATWEVSVWLGDTAVIEIVDRLEHGGVQIGVDQIYQSDKNRVNTSFVYDARKTVKFDKQYLNVPVKKGATSQLLRIFIDDEKVREFRVELAEAEPDYWMFLDVSEWQGKEGVIQIARMPEGSDALKSIFVDNTVPGFENLYREEDRPQFHFTSRRGWLNDPNGLLFYEGEYHIFYQHNPVGWNWGNISWGHAVSPDLVHWEELAPAIYPDQMGMEWSGSGVVDHYNTAGFKEGEETPLVINYTAAGAGGSDYHEWSKGEPFTQCIAYSTDKGRSWTKYEENPVLDHIAGSNRDPKVVWYEPDEVWIMALYLGWNNFGLFRSADLKSWIPIQEIIIEGGGECPDFFQVPLDGDRNNMKWVFTAANGRFLAGTFDGQEFTPETEEYPSEWGGDYFAVQTFSNIQDGRCIQIGWMSRSPFEEMPFNQQFAFPRELTLRTTPGGIRLFGNPVREIENIHGEHQSWNDLTVKPGDNPLSSLEGEIYHIIAEFQVDKGTDGEFGFNLRGTEIMYHTGNNMLTAVCPSDDMNREVKLLPDNGMIRMEILLDRASVEAFANNGEIPMAFYNLPGKEIREISLTCKEGNVFLKSLDVYELNSIWRNIPR